MKLLLLFVFLVGPILENKVASAQIRPFLRRGWRVRWRCGSGSMGEPTRRVDVETKWLKSTGISAAKDAMSIELFYKRQNQSEEKIYKVSDPGSELARKLLD